MLNRESVSTRWEALILPGRHLIEYNRIIKDINRYINGKGNTLLKIQQGETWHAGVVDVARLGGAINGAFEKWAIFDWRH